MIFAKMPNHSLENLSSSFLLKSLMQISIYYCTNHTGSSTYLEIVGKLMDMLYSMLTQMWQCTKIFEYYLFEYYMQ